jgi:hypothetical protein
VSKTIDGVAEMLKVRLAELDDEAGRLRRALASLDGGSAAPAAKQMPRKPRRRRAKRAARGARRAQFLAAVGANQKASVAEIAEQMGVSTNQAAGLARGLEASGEIKRSKRGISLTAKATAS